MMPVLTRLASLRLSLAGMIGVLVLALLGNSSPAFGHGWVALPLAFLSVNLLAAIITNGVFRKQAALLVFHVCLLAVILLIGIGVLLRFDGHVELVEGERFSANNVQVSQLGMWHPSNMDQVSFTQGTVEISYLPGLIRRNTRSVLSAHRANGEDRHITIGDRIGATFGDYRFIATFNKGFALIVLWSDGEGNLQRGSINFPSYPEYEWKQVNSWSLPGGRKISFDLKLDSPASRDEAWVLRSADIPFAVAVGGDGIRAQLLRPGEAMDLPGGSLRIEDLRLWMGYRIDFNPLLPWVFAAAMLALVALAVHFQMQFWPGRQASRSTSLEGIRAYDSCD